MSVREIPTAYEHKCDGCGVIEVRNSKERPKYWTGLHIAAHAYDYHGCACADASVDRLLCRECTTVVHGAINAAIEDARQARANLEDKS